MRAFTSILMMVAMVGQSFAQTITIQNDINARSSANFRSRANVVALIPKGSEGSVLEQRKMPSGNYAIKIKITTLGKEIGSNLSVGDEVWIYYHQDQSRRLVELYDDKKQVAQPEAATRSKALKSFEIQNQKSQVKRQSDESCVATSAFDRKVQKSLSEQVECLKKFSAENAEQVDPTVEEILTFINSIRPGSPQTNRKIAVNVKKYCELYGKGMPIPFVLANMAQESKMDPNAGSYKGAAGLLQLMPGTARELAGGKKVNRYDIETNLKLAIKNLGNMFVKYSGDLIKVMIGHNAGEGRLGEIIDGKKGIPSETKTHIKKVTDYLEDYMKLIEKTGLNFD